jgi:small subunit ribosomal protein S17e
LQGRVRTKTVKRSARTIVERYYSKLHAADFDTNKRVVDEVGAVHGATLWPCPPCGLRRR